MRPELERLRLIELQLTHSPTALSAGEWQLRQLLDADLTADTDLQRQLYQGLRLAGRQQLRHELRQLHARLYAPRAAGWLTWLRRLLNREPVRLLLLFHSLRGSVYRCFFGQPGPAVFLSTLFIAYA